MNKIYLVEDDPTIVSVVKEHLNQWSYQCVSQQNFQTILQEFIEIQPDLVILDISLPFYNGFYWCQEIRKISEVPILFLSSASEQMNQVMAMSMGADDFIAKPFDLAILLAKIQAMLRRSYQYGHQISTYTFQGFTFTPNENLIQKEQLSLPVTPNESRILNLLLQQRGMIVSRERIIETLWQSDEFIDNNTLAVNITRLRKKLMSIGIQDLIQTVKNKGYIIEGN